MPRIYDAFVFLGDDLDVLAERFAALSEVPGLVHVICEAPVTPSGEPKPMWFWEARQSGRFACWHGRWNHVRVEPWEITGATPAEREAALREYLLHGIAAEPGDIVLYGDVKDIPDPAAVTDLARRRTVPPMTLGATVARHFRDTGTLAELEKLRLSA